MAKILIADDEEMIRELVFATLSRDRSFEIMPATNGREALEIARDRKPDIVILDVRMPEMTGYEVCDVLKQQFGAAMFVMMLTAMGQPRDIEAGKAVGADDYFVKPFSPAALLKKLYGVLEKAA